MNCFDPNAYGDACAELLRNAPLCELGPGSPKELAADRLRALDDRGMFGKRSVVDREMAACCRSGLWLLFDFLDESHRISQNIHTPSGSYWHGIMHRREPDFSNANYWFRRTGEHPVYAALQEGACALYQGSLDPAAVFLAEGETWDPFQFVDLCEAVARGRAGCDDLCRGVAQVEWQLLFDFCYQRAVGSS